MQRPSVSHLPLVGLILAVMVLSGCDSEVQRACPDVDWYQAGYQDGFAGERGLRIENVRVTCSKVDAWNKPRPDRALYFSGWKKGVIEYCSPANGLALGKKGVSFKTICPAELTTDFENAYREGRKAFDGRQSLDARKGALRKQIKQLEAEQYQLKAQLAQSENQSEYDLTRNRLRDNARRLRESTDELQSLEATGRGVK
ncbi:MAG: DUF2799 domain-containing protein [Nitrosomonadales bacterium]|nr:DUF2799 domain-containing protein [Nitrosomonadales bacterium]